MPKYRVNIARVVWESVEIDASAPEEAFDLANERLHGLCFQCAGWNQKHSLDIGDDALAGDVWDGDTKVHEFKEWPSND